MAGVGDIVVIIGIFSLGGIGGADETAPNIEFALVIDADHGARKRQRLRRRVCLTLLKRLDLLRQVLQASLDWFIKIAVLNRLVFSAEVVVVVRGFSPILSRYRFGGTEGGKKLPRVAPLV